MGRSPFRVAPWLAGVALVLAAVAGCTPSHRGPPRHVARAPCVVRIVIENHSSLPIVDGEWNIDGCGGRVTFTAPGDTFSDQRDCECGPCVGFARVVLADGRTFACGPRPGTWTTGPDGRQVCWVHFIVTDDGCR